jgi:hypothetical protein
LRNWSETKKELINGTITAWESSEICLVNRLVDQMPEQFGEVITNEEDHISD